MNFALSDDDMLLRDSARAFVDRETQLAPLLVPGATVAAAPYAANWQQVRNLGWPALVVPEADGGLGLGDVQLAVIVMELGRTLLPSPFAGHTFATWAVLRAAASELRSTLLADAAAGTRTLALVPPTDANAVAVDGGRLGGSHDFVMDASSADVLIVAAHDAAGVLGLYAVDAGAPGVHIAPQPWRDITRQVDRVSFDAVQARPLTAGGELQWQPVADHIATFLAAENVGVIRRVLADTVDYANERKAFGRLIGSYQAIKHPLAEMFGQLEAANTAVLYAAWALGQADERASLAASMAKAYADDAACAATHRSIQTFGAIGFTWEMHVQLFFKRARANAVLFGDARSHRERVVELATGRRWTLPAHAA